MLCKYPGLYREQEHGTTWQGNIFHQAVEFAVVLHGKRGKADVRVLKALIEHDLQYCSMHEGRTEYLYFYLHQ